jgi:hypothetical protein
MAASMLIQTISSLPHWGRAWRKQLTMLLANTSLAFSAVNNRYHRVAIS